MLPQTDTAKILKVAGKDLESRPLKDIILNIPHRFHYITRVKAPLFSIITSPTLSFRDLPILKKYVGMFPNPTKSNCFRHNSIILLDVIEELHSSLDWLSKLFAKQLIIEYEHDIYYSDRFDWFLKMLIKYGWNSWNSYEHNLRILKRIEKEFFLHETNGCRIGLFRSVFSIGFKLYSISKYRELSGRIIDGILSRDWRPDRHGVMGFWNWDTSNQEVDIEVY